ncbi:MAG TPA: aldo/keto reductase [Anaerolineae bacterium]|nr:aldo/keto reductase [Anaerolineae bacterium]
MSHYQTLGRTGLNVSNICLGTMQFGWTASEQTAYQIIDTALDLGCNFLDTADIYSRWHEPNAGGESETIIGRWLAQTSHPRHQLILATKVRGPMGTAPTEQGLSRHHILNSVHASLKRLQTDYIDLYQIHWPDESVPLDDTLRTLDGLVTAGKVRYIGCSNYPAWLLMKSLWISDIRHLVRFDTLQPHYNLVHRAEFERELQAVCADQQIGVLPYSPLAGGFLTGKYQPDKPQPSSARADRNLERYGHERGWQTVRALDEVATELNASIPQVAVAWVLANPTVTSAIIGANTPQQLKDTYPAANLTLTSTQKEKLDTASQW